MARRQQQGRSCHARPEADPTCWYRLPVRPRRCPSGPTRQPAGEAAMHRLIVTQVARLKALALRIEKAIAAVFAAPHDLAAWEALLRTAPGEGPIVAACLLARMPGLGRLSSRQVAALAGLAPFDRQSGKTSRPGRCSGGRPSVKRSLYLAALTIERSGKGNLAATTSQLRPPAILSSLRFSPPCESSSSRSTLWSKTTSNIVMHEHSRSGQDYAV